MTVWLVFTDDDVRVFARREDALQYAVWKGGAMWQAKVEGFDHATH